MHPLASARMRTRFKLHAWVVMPEHVHLRIWPELPDFPVSKIAWVLKRDSARFMIARWKASEARILEKIRASDGSLRFWQPGGGDDRNILATDELPEKIRYIHSNPVRRGLVDHPIEWAWSSARWYAGEHDGQHSIDEVRCPEPS